jgi:hypothetical protein
LKIKIKIAVDGEAFEFEGDRLSQVRDDAIKSVIQKIYKRELEIAGNKTNAVYNTAALLDISTSTIWSVVKKFEGK